MTNKEKYAKELLDILCETGETPAMVKGKLVACDHTTCDECKFGKHTMFCSEKFTNWAKAEYEVPEVDWTKVPVDTKILVRNSIDQEWLKRHFSHFDGIAGKVRAFAAGDTSWSADERHSTVMWEYAKIADPDEREKYLKHE